MFERSPSYFEQFQKQFKFLVTNEKINFSNVKTLHCVLILIQHFVSWQRQQNILTIFMFW